SHCLTSFSSGGKGTRTPNPLLAKQVRYQLRHTPEGAFRLHRIGVLRPLLLPAAVAAAEEPQGSDRQCCGSQKGEPSLHDVLPSGCVGLRGLEPLTSSLSAKRSTRLSYRPPGSCEPRSHYTDTQAPKQNRPEPASRRVLRPIPPAATRG